MLLQDLLEVDEEEAHCGLVVVVVVVVEQVFTPQARLRSRLIVR